MIQYSVVRGKANFNFEGNVFVKKTTPKEFKKALRSKGIEAYNFRKFENKIICSDRNNPDNKKIHLSFEKNII